MMVKAKAKKGSKLVCIPCGREVVIDNYGLSGSTLWCCGKAMSKKTPALVKKTKAKLAKKRK